MKTLFRLLRRLVVLVCIAAVLLTALPPLAREADRLLYPRKYSRQVEQWAAEYELDPLLVYAFIRTESGFDPAATSSVEARGLMQMTEETFIWLRSKIAPDEGLLFANLYDPETSIRFGCYYLHLCMERYNGDVATAAAAWITTHRFVVNMRCVCFLQSLMIQKWVLFYNIIFKSFCYLYISVI